MHKPKLAKSRCNVTRYKAFFSNGIPCFRIKRGNKSHVAIPWTAWLQRHEMVIWTFMQQPKRKQNPFGYRNQYEEVSPRIRELKAIYFSRYVKIALVLLKTYLALNKRKLIKNYRLSLKKSWMWSVGPFTTLEMCSNPESHHIVVSKMQHFYVSLIW